MYSSVISNQIFILHLHQQIEPECFYIKQLQNTNNRISKHSWQKQQEDASMKTNMENYDYVTWLNWQWLAAKKRKKKLKAQTGRMQQLFLIISVYTHVQQFIIMSWWCSQHFVWHFNNTVIKNINLQNQIMHAQCMSN